MKKNISATVARDVWNNSKKLSIDSSILPLNNLNLQRVSNDRGNNRLLEICNIRVRELWTNNKAIFLPFAFGSS